MSATRYPGMRPALLAAVLLVLAAACGSNAESASGPKAAAASPKTEATAGEPGAPGSGAPGEGGDAAPSPGDPADAGAADVKAAGAEGEEGGGGDPIFDQTGAILPLSATFASACVRPGTPQTITVRSAPDVEVIYHATYSDGKNARDRGYYGGNNLGTTDAEGKWKDTWVVDVDASPGKVRVDVVASSWEAFRHIETEFAVAGFLGRCA